MQVTIRYTDTESLTVEEVVKQAQHFHGKGANVTVVPDSFLPHDLIYFAVQSIITHKQLSMLYDDKFAYQGSVQKLRNETLVKLGEIIDQVIIDNEEKVS